MCNNYLTFIFDQHNGPYARWGEEKRIMLSGRQVGFILGTLALFCLCLVVWSNLNVDSEPIQDQDQAQVKTGMDAARAMAAALQEIRREEQENCRKIQEILGCGFDQCQQYCLLDFPHEPVNELTEDDGEILKEFWEAAEDMDKWEEDGFYYRRRVAALTNLIREKDEEIEYLRSTSTPPMGYSSEQVRELIERIEHNASLDCNRLLGLDELALDECLDLNPHDLPSQEWFLWNDDCHGDPDHWFWLGEYDGGAHKRLLKKTERGFGPALF